MINSNSMHKLILFFFFAFSTQLIIAQNDDVLPAPAPENPFSHFDELLKQFNFNEQGNGIFMDTMIIKQFGDLGIDGQNFEESMQEMMKLLTEQFEGFNFGDRQDFDQLFEDFDLESFPHIEDDLIPKDPNSNGQKDVKKPKKKGKTYKL